MKITVNDEAALSGTLAISGGISVAAVGQLAATA